MEDIFTQPSTALTLALTIITTTTTTTTTSATSTTSTTHCPHDQVSTAFALWDPSWTSTKKRKAEEEDLADHGKPSTENVDIVSTKLSLYHDPWKIKKTLTNSDLGNLSRLLVATNLINDHVLPYLDDKLAKRIVTKEGAEVTVYDCDTNLEYQLVLKRWEHWKSYVFINKWKKKFVERRQLKEGDEIGFYWDTPKSRFVFSVLKRTSQCLPTAN